MPSTVKPTLNQVIQRKLEKRMQAFCVAQAGIVTKVSAGAPTRTVTVKPATHRLVPNVDEDSPDVVEEYAEIQNVPVCWPKGRNVSVKGTLAVGDSVLIIALDRDMSVFRRTGTDGEPEDTRTHEWSSCIAIPGLLPDTDTIPDPTDAAALASKIASELALIKAALDTIAAAAGAANSYATPATQTQLSSTVLKVSS